MKLPLTDIPRPSFASVLAETIELDVIHWISSLEAKIGKEAYTAFIADLPEPDATPSFRTLLLAAIINPGKFDAFAICEALKRVLDWPVDTDLVEVFIKGIRHTSQRGFRQAMYAWVMRTGMRFHPKAGDRVSFHPDTNPSETYTGTVVDVDRLVATAVVDCGGTRYLVPAEMIAA